ncbi:MAG: hypothetical protein QXJ73_05310 [Candidatus Caldarchaeum sp.]
MSLADFTGEEYLVLSWLQSIVENPKNFVRIVDIDIRTGEVMVLHDPPSVMSLGRLFETLDKLERRGLVKSDFERKLAKCVKCSKTIFQPHLTCPECGGEDVEKVVVFLHSCGANLSEHILSETKNCPKCGDLLNLNELTESRARFACNRCGAIFDKPELRAECLSCGDVRNVVDLVFEDYRKYMITEGGLLFLEARNPLRVLVKKLLEAGYRVSEKVELRGISGTTHQVDLLAISLNETRVYDVRYYVDAETLLRFAVKRLDVEKTQIPGALGKVRWIMASVEVAEAAVKTAETFGIEVEVVRYG